ncbi:MULTISPECIES: DeoR/GlpR family DNA-binding transcription regulator [Neobacillus]|uniref:DeoR/GlpR transcriptional regulator n=1 Tax=Neobacillus rhizophilus TaxID=2833579 RepID=A0A942U3K2_9BACI|nr:MULTISPECIES: DeoR/GlpR family DNA-binding transcription regulator [Neobacillus]MBS4210949.1 DeoR/GlpR transcriptional regulator [Neobacillus rhizophilus]MBU8917502.1 DeoR/GlpR family DNA-binding transcription regulator [Bacillus sp. FJAT-29953]
MSLSYEERKTTIMESLEKEEKVQVRVLANLLQVSDETIRRDLDRLEKEGFLKKVYGGAVKNKIHSWELPFDEKTTINQKEKQAICKAAADLVEDGDIIMIGNGTTPLDMISYLSDKKDITLITHSVPVMLGAMDSFKGRVIFIGGEIERNQKYMSGPLSERMLEMLRADKTFVCAGGISTANGITDYDISGSSISRKMMERAEEVIVLADHSKFGKTTFAYMCSITDASKIITDQSCPDEWKKIISAHGVELIVADEF